LLSFLSSNQFCNLQKFRLQVVAYCIVLKSSIQSTGLLLNAHFVQIFGYWISQHLMLLWGWTGLCLSAQCILVGNSSG
jgi:hypothetical protein